MTIFDGFFQPNIKITFISMAMLDMPIRPSYVTSDEMVCSSLLIMSRLLVNIMIVVKY